MKIINKFDREDGKPKTCEKEKAYCLKFADGEFYYESMSYIDTLFQDDYERIHDIIADLFYKQLNGKNYAYTSSGSVAGHHNMDNSGTLIFSKGLPYYVFDEDKENKDDDAEVQLTNNLENWDVQ